MILRVLTALEKRGDGIGICGCGSDGDYGDWIANSLTNTDSDGSSARTEINLFFWATFRNTGDNNSHGRN